MILGDSSLIITERLNIRIASDDEMRELIAEQTDEGLKAAYGEMLAGCIAHPAQRQWYAVWLIGHKNGEHIGELCFKGLPPDGAVEIGYGLSPEFWGKGYATEAVTAAAEWASQQPGVTAVEAETDDGNIASQRVLAKSSFVPTGTRGEEGPRFVYRAQQ